MQQTATTKRPQTQVRTLGSRCITFAVLYRLSNVMKMVK